ncbi:Acetylornithine deacetylase [Planctomycetes bacterium Pan216]|uniref:Probable succinyl-diaminopimelate desuccinylase n=1 Tax=Kolteria novifilia TaxID=2527975 RepID=A0A518B0A3_9BACT|nr:Acetylornithine deacetylase [Planctomycetes bacterium Pan216]
MLTVASERVLDTLADLVRIKSVNPAYDDGVPEGEIADYVDRFFAERDIETTRQEVWRDRPNVIARLPGRDSSRRIVLEAHTDTVAVTGMTIPPFSPRLVDGKLYGRGSCDTKAGLAAMMHAVASLKQEGIVPPCDVLLAATVDEEYSYRGVLKCCEGLKADAAIVAEPTDLRLVTASKGLVRFRVLTKGKAAHSSKPHLGRNAINAMAHLLVTLEADSAQLADVQHPLLGPATCNVGVINGGVQINFVPESCVIEIDRRRLPGEGIEEVLDHYQRLFDGLGFGEREIEVTMESPLLTDEPLETPADAMVVRVAAKALERLGRDSEIVGVPFGSDASKFSARGIPSIIMGPGSIDQAHAAVEFVDCEQVLQAQEIYRQWILGFDAGPQA